jgi:16S rRNA (guanine(966)-N(2))-methyltransferase RsmD
MRIISGTAKGKQLRTFSTRAIRPTSDRVREALFSILTSRMGSLAEMRVLDVCAGTGALGLEALSRGAQHGVFIDNSRHAAELIAYNSRLCHLEPQVQIIKSTYSNALSRLSGIGFGLVFIDPPYNKDLLPDIISTISTHNLLLPEGIICAEESRNAHIECNIGGYACIDTRSYGDTCIYLFSAKKAV